MIMTWNWIPPLVVAAVVIGFILLKRLGQVPAEVARGYLKHGALVIDVRSAGEFNSGHLPVALNIPLDEIETTLPRRVNDKRQVLLLHCLSGTRSAFARRTLKRMGYQYVFNLGSYGRAQRVVTG